MAKFEVCCVVAEVGQLLHHSNLTMNPSCKKTLGSGRIHDVLSASTLGQPGVIVVSTVCVLKPPTAAYPTVLLRRLFLPILRLE
jgi:hypothetical protein